MDRRNNMQMSGAASHAPNQKPELMLHEYLTNKVQGSRDHVPQNTPSMKLTSNNAMKVLPPIKAQSSSLERTIGNNNAAFSSNYS